MSEVKTILLLADIHANIHALQSVLYHVDTTYGKPDYIFGLGDFVGYGAFPNEVIEIAKERFDVMVMGNHDLAVALGNADGFNKSAKAAV